MAAPISPSRADLRAAGAELERGWQLGLPGAADREALLVGELLGEELVPPPLREAIASLPPGPLAIEVDAAWEDLPTSTLAVPGVGPLALHPELAPFSPSGPGEAPSEHSACVLLVLGALDGDHPIDAAAEHDALSSALEGLPVAIRVVPTLSLPALRDELTRHRPAVVHIAGHGVAGGLRSGDGRIVSATALWRQALSAWPPALVTLAACRSARPGRGTDSLAAGLGEAGVRAVIGMASVVGDRYLRRFAAGLYGRVMVDAQPVAQAVADTRREVHQEHLAEADRARTAASTLGWWAAAAAHLHDPSHRVVLRGAVTVGGGPDRLGSIGDLQLLAGLSGSQGRAAPSPAALDSATVDEERRADSSIGDRNGGGVILAPWGYPVKAIVGDRPGWRVGAGEPVGPGLRVCLPGASDRELAAIAAATPGLAALDPWSRLTAALEARGNPAYLRELAAALTRGASGDDAREAAHLALAAGRDPGPLDDLLARDPTARAVVDALLPACLAVPLPTLQTLVGEPHAAALPGTLLALMEVGALAPTGPLDHPATGYRAPPWAVGRLPPPPAGWGNGAPNEPAFRLALALEVSAVRAPAPTATRLEALRGVGPRRAVGGVAGPARALRVARELELDGREGLAEALLGTVLEALPPGSHGRGEVLDAWARAAQRRGDAEEATRRYRRAQAEGAPASPLPLLEQGRALAWTLGFAVIGAPDAEPGAPLPAEHIRLASLLARGNLADAAVLALSYAEGEESAGNLGTARLWRARAIRLAPVLADASDVAGRLALAARGLVYSDPDRARARFDEAMEALAPPARGPHAALAMGLLARDELRDPDRARRALQHAWDHGDGPLRCEAGEALALLLHGAGLPGGDGIAAAVVAAPAAWPKTRFSARKVRAAIAAGEGRWRDAVAHADEALAHCPPGDDAHPFDRAVAVALAAQGRLLLLEELPPTLRAALVHRVSGEVAAARTACQSARSGVPSLLARVAEALGMPSVD